MPRIRLQSTKGDEVIAEWTRDDSFSSAAAEETFNRLQNQGCIPFNLVSQERIETFNPELEADVLFIRPITGGA